MGKVVTEIRITDHADKIFFKNVKKVSADLKWKVFMSWCQM